MKKRIIIGMLVGFVGGGLIGFAGQALEMNTFVTLGLAVLFGWFITPVICDYLI